MGPFDLKASRTDIYDRIRYNMDQASSPRHVAHKHSINTVGSLNTIKNIGRSSSVMHDISSQLDSNWGYIADETRKDFELDISKPQQWRNAMSSNRLKNLTKDNIALRNIIIQFGKWLREQALFMLDLLWNHIFQQDSKKRKYWKEIQAGLLIHVCMNCYGMVKENICIDN